jgi:hypothetical protein
MALSIRQAAPGDGVQWLGRAFALFMRRALPFTGMFVSFLLVALLVSLLPVVGGVLMLMTLPLLSLGFMLASRAARGNGLVHPGLFIEPLRAGQPRRNALLTLCAAYALATVLIMTFSDWVDGGAFERLQRLMAEGEEGHAELDALLGDPQLSWGLLARFGLAAALSVPFWHAPALVHWQGQSAGQALFSSTLAVWRCKGAFFAYSLAWAGVIAVFGTLLGLLFALFGAKQLAGLVAMPAGLMFSTVFYVSLLFTYEGCFSDDTAPQPEARLEAP